MGSKYSPEAIKIANIQTNLTYIFASCLQQACEDMDEYLSKINLDLRYDNKKAMKEVLDYSRKLNTSIDRLFKMSILTCDEDCRYQYEDTKFKYYAILMMVTQLVGSDDLSEVRFLCLYNLLSKFETHLSFDKLPIRENMGFAGTRKRLAEGEWDKEVVRTCLKIKDNED